VLFCVNQVAKLLGSGVGITQQDLGILLKDESIEVSLQCKSCLQSHLLALAL